MSGLLFIRLSNAFVSPESEPPIINVRYEWSGISGHFGLCSFMFSFEM